MCDTIDKAASNFIISNDSCQSQETIDLVVEYILATKAHKIGPDDAADQDLKLFIDIDMSVLGQLKQGKCADLKGTSFLFGREHA